MPRSGYDLSVATTFYYAAASSAFSSAGAASGVVSSFFSSFSFMVARLAGNALSISDAVFRPSTVEVFYYASKRWRMNV